MESGVVYRLGPSRYLNTWALVACTWYYRVRSQRNRTPTSTALLNPDKHPTHPRDRITRREPVLARVGRHLSCTWSVIDIGEDVTMPTYNGMKRTRRQSRAHSIASVSTGRRGLAVSTIQVEGNARGDMPTSGAMRPGPVGLKPPVVRRRGINPIAIKIEKAQVDAQIESQAIQDGVMLDPSGPYVVAWYEDTGQLGQETNLVFAGHLDYYDVGEAVFFHLGQLAEGDEIQIIGEGDEPFTYAVEWARNYTVEELDTKAVQEIVGKTKTENVTLITCGGPFDFNVGQYLERYVVRARRSDT